MTQKLYDADAYLFAFSATVLSCEQTEGGFVTVLDRTAFFPEEGGQSCDTGRIGDAQVLRVEIDGETIRHITDSAVTGACACVIDSAPRLDKMRQHTGEHIVCGIVHRLYGFDNVGFHLGDDDVTFDFNGMLSKNEIADIERQANEAVIADLPVTAYYPEHPEMIDYRSKGGIDGAVRIVEIEGIDRCACCAPHVSRTGEVGIIKITSFESYKGGVRLHMCCGLRALYDYRQKQQNLEKIALSLSSGTNNAAEYFSRFEEETARLRRTVSALRQQLVQLKMSAVQSTDGNLLLFEEHTDARLAVNLLSGRYGGVCAVFSGNDADGYRFAAASESMDTQALVSMLRRQLSAKCGGSKLIQGSVKATREQIEQFFEKI